MKVLAAPLVVIACLFAIPATAAAAPTTFTVDTIADETDTGGLNGTCTTGAGKCSLRAAIEESNASTADDDTIVFAANPFDGKTGDTIAILTSLPLITDKVHIDGDSAGQCTTSAAGLPGPCVEVSGPASGSALSAEADGVEIDGLAITGAVGTGAAAIRAFNGAQGLVVRDNWIGVKLDGGAGANNKGVYLDPDSNGATIGGTTSADRNVIASNEFEGLDIEGASEAAVLGNYFGVKPDGSTTAANVGKNIEITDTVAFEAIDNEVGTAVASGPAPCDGGCNVISGSTFGIDLEGNGVGQNEEPATGPTTVHGNFIGLNAAGTATVANATGINVGSAPDALIGGPADLDANFIAGGSEGVFASGAEGLAVLGNIVGSGAAGAEITAPGKGVWILNLGNLNPVTVSDNAFEMDGGGIAIEARFGGTEIIGNLIEGGSAGIYTTGLAPAIGSLIEGNFVGGAVNGILIEGDENEVVGNEIVLSSGAGIKVKQAGPPFTVGTTGNLIGGNTEADENLIYESGGDAIEIVDLEGTQNEVARNAGSDNAGLFIDLLAFEPGTEPNGPNGGIDPPGLSTAAKAEATGSAEPNALVRVFRKGSVSPGELDSFLGEAIADGSGNWKVTYAALPGETRIAATQTNEEGGTSEVSAVATTPADPDTGGGGGGKDDKAKDDKGNGKEKGKGKGDSGKGGAIQTTIRKAKVTGTAAKFKFSASEKGAKFECKLDRKKFKPCKSPKTYKKLKPGKHVFKVRAVKGKTVDPTPAKRKFKIVE